ncbi:uncharacterized protein RBU57_000947 isoform 1-T1 [Macrochelys suwanniensis]
MHRSLAALMLGCVLETCISCISEKQCKGLVESDNSGAEGERTLVIYQGHVPDLQGLLLWVPSQAWSTVVGSRSKLRNFSYVNNCTSRSGGVPESTGDGRALGGRFIASSLDTINQPLLDRSLRRPTLWKFIVVRGRPNGI